VRRNQARLFGADVVRDIGRPVLGAGAGFFGARLAGNGLARVDAVTGALGENWTRVLGNGVAMIGTLWASRRVPIIARNRGSLVAGMGLAALDNVLAELGGEGGPLAFLSGNAYSGVLGAYHYADVSDAGAPYDSMMGEYVTEPVLGEYVSTDADQMLGEYVQDGGYYEGGINPGNQAQVDSLIDAAESQAGISGMGQTPVYEAAAGMGQTPVYEAAAGMGQLTRDYLVAGLGQTPVYEAAAGLGRLMKSRAFRRRDLATISTEAAPMPAARISGHMRSVAPIYPSTQGERAGTGYAAGIFGAHLFDPMMAG